MEITENLLESVRTHIQEVLTDDRYSHSIRVANTARTLSVKYGISEIKSYFAALSHDMCKCDEPSELLTLAAKDGKPISNLEKEKPVLLHGRAAAVKLQNTFNVSDEEILEAVRVHTFGQKGMCDIAKIVYVADKIEPDRPHVNLSYMESIAPLSLDELVKKVLLENIAHLKQKGASVAKDTEELLSSLESTSESSQEKCSEESDVDTK